MFVDVVEDNIVVVDDANDDCVYDYVYAYDYVCDYDVNDLHDVNDVNVWNDDVYVSVFYVNGVYVSDFF